VCFFGKFSHCDRQQKFEKFWDFFEKSNFFLNAEILEKFAKLWKPQD
jgi:aminopeptidase C